MPRTLTQPLARSTRSELLEAQRACRDLLWAARTLAAVSGHDPTNTDCAVAGCLLPGTGDDGDICSLARRLAAVAPHRDEPVLVRPEAALERFVTLLGYALDAVRTCRQTAHASGRCWFSATPGDDGCAEVLHLAHDLA